MMTAFKNWCLLMAMAAVWAGAPMQSKALAAGNAVMPTVEDPDPFPIPLPPPPPDPDRPGAGDVRV